MIFSFWLVFKRLLIRFLVMPFEQKKCIPCGMHRFVTGLRFETMPLNWGIAGLFATLLYQPDSPYFWSMELSAPLLIP